MKIIFASLVLLASGIFAVAQNEQAPIYLKEVEFKNWNYTDSRTGKAVNLRDYTKGKKLVAVVYYAPWCPNWRHDAPMVEKLYEKYKDKGFAVIGVSEYDTVDAAQSAFHALSQGAKVTMPLAPAFWAKTFGMLTDRFGVDWGISGEPIPMR